MNREGRLRNVLFLLDLTILEVKTFHVHVDVSVRWRGCLCQLYGVNLCVSLVSEGVFVRVWQA